MTKVEMHLRDETFQRVRDAAQASHLTVEQWLAWAVEQATAVSLPSDTLLGLFAQEPDIIDSVVEDAMASRESSPFRVGHG